MDEAHKGLVTYIRSVHEWCARTKSGGDWFAIDPDESPFKAADAIEALAGEVARLKGLREFKQNLTAELVRLTKELVGARAASINLSSELASAIAERDRLKAALERLVKSVGDECFLDHNGNCQAHFIDSPCAMAIARKELKGEA